LFALFLIPLLRENDPDAPRKRRKVEAEMKVSGADWERFPKDVDEFDLQHAQGKGKFTFDFVEGLLVKALRAGDWYVAVELHTVTLFISCFPGFSLTRLT
jgi:midasin